MLSFATAEAMVVILTEDNLIYLEIIKGTIVPKIPTKKADLIALCKELQVDFEGTAKVLKSRLTKTLNLQTS